MRKFVKGDEIIVITGKDKGKKGKIVKVFPIEQKVIVEDVNKVKRHQKPSYTHQGGIVEKEMPISWSNISHIDPKSGRPTRVRVMVNEHGVKVRVAVKSGEKIGSES